MDIDDVTKGFKETAVYLKKNYIRWSSLLHVTGEDQEDKIKIFRRVFEELTPMQVQ